MEKCFIGFGQSGNAANHKFSFKGQMSAVYLFGEPLSHSAIAAIYRLGPGYKVSLYCFCVMFVLKVPPPLVIILPCFNGCTWQSYLEIARCLI